MSLQDQVERLVMFKSPRILELLQRAHDETAARIERDQEWVVVLNCAIALLTEEKNDDQPSNDEPVQPPG